MKVGALSPADLPISPAMAREIATPGSPMFDALTLPLLDLMREMNTCDVALERYRYAFLRLNPDEAPTAPPQFVAHLILIVCKSRGLIP